jgi:hypothetical protein
MDSSVSGGEDNEARAEGSSISGGYYNVTGGENVRLTAYENAHDEEKPELTSELLGLYSSISGGAFDYALGMASSVSGGESSASQGAVSSVTGGFENSADSEGSSINGGSRNRTQTRSFGAVGGGHEIVEELENGFGS